MDHSSDPASPAKPTPDKGTASACSGGIIVAAALAGLGSQFACTISWHLRSLAPQPVLAVRVVPDGQFLPATPLVPFALVPNATGHSGRSHPGGPGPGVAAGSPASPAG
jgi:hypothetical protein